jgi:hypothetical protein
VTKEQRILWDAYLDQVNDRYSKFLDTFTNPTERKVVKTASKMLSDTIRTLNSMLDSTVLVRVLEYEVSVVKDEQEAIAKLGKYEPPNMKEQLAEMFGNGEDLHDLLGEQVDPLKVN